MEQAFECDENKRQKNLETHGIDFADTRKDYGETRYILMGELHDLFFQVAFTRRGTTVRIISARRGNKRERRIYEQREDD